MIAGQKYRQVQQCYFMDKYCVLKKEKGEKKRGKIAILCQFIFLCSLYLFTNTQVFNIENWSLNLSVTPSLIVAEPEALSLSLYIYKVDSFSPWGNGFLTITYGPLKTDIQ